MTKPRPIPENNLRLERTLELQPSSQDVITWSVDESGDVVQGPLDLSFLLGKVLQLVLNAGQVALHVQAGELRAVFLEGSHTLRVGRREGELPPESEILFLSLVRPLAFAWKGQASIWVPDADGAPSELRLVGECVCQITGPEAFYNTFLRHAEREGGELTCRVVDALIRSRLEKYLGDLARERKPDPEASAEELLHLTPADISGGLAALGLGCRSLSVRPAGAACPAPGEISGQSATSHVNKTN
jgi:hypothetical protein